MINIAVCDDEANIRAYLACKKGRGISWGIKCGIDSELPVSMKQTKASLHGMD